MVSIKNKGLPGLVLIIVVLLAFGITAFASGTTTATVPVTLTVDNQYRAVNVTVPAALPVQVINGVVITADSARITNNSRGSAIQVTGVSVTDGAYKIGNYLNFGGANTIALKINGCPTSASGPLLINETAFPVIRPSSALELEYFAKISADAPNSANVHAANIIFTISIVNE